MADKLKFCHICSQKHVSKPSTVWCSECEQVFCSECESYHSLIQFAKEHMTTPIETYLSLDESIRQIHTCCSLHDEKYEMFCKTHDLQLCNFCVDEHSDCKGVSSLKPLKNVKTANEIDESLRDIEKNQHTKNKISFAVIKTRKTINAHVDKLEKPAVNLKINKLLSFETSNNNIYGCDIFPDGTIIITDNNEQCLICTDSTGKHLFSISVAPNRPIDVAIIDDKTVAVTTGPAKEIIIVDIDSRTILRSIIVEYNCWGVAHRDETLLLCAANHGIMSINLANDKISKNIQCELPVLSYITSYKDKVYYTDYESETVICCDIKGHTIWVFKDQGVMRCPCGITTDNTGHVFVCDGNNQTVIILYDDGRQLQSKTIISRDDGLDTPYALHFDKNRNNLLVTNNKKTAFLFHLSS